MDYKKITVLGLTVLGVVSLGINAHAGSPQGINWHGNIVLEQEREGRVAFYENDVKYLKDEIERLKSQL